MKFKLRGNNFQCLLQNTAGVLNNGRFGHGVIFDGEKFLIIGGDIRQGVKKALKTEVCTLENLKMTCVELSTALQNYESYPELFLVTDDFGSDKSQC